MSLPAVENGVDHAARYEEGRVDAGRPREVAVALRIVRRRAPTAIRVSVAGPPSGDRSASDREHRRVEPLGGRRRPRVKRGLCVEGGERRLELAVPLLVRLAAADAPQAAAGLPPGGRGPASPLPSPASPATRPTARAGTGCDRRAGARRSRAPLPARERRPDRRRGARTPRSRSGRRPPRRRRRPSRRLPWRCRGGSS